MTVRISSIGITDRHSRIVRVALRVELRNVASFHWPPLSSHFGWVGYLGRKPPQALIGRPSAAPNPLTQYDFLEIRTRNKISFLDLLCGPQRASSSPSLNPCPTRVKRGCALTSLRTCLFR